MTFRFAIGSSMELMFYVAGAAPEPEPQPAPVSIYSDFAVVFTNVLTGSVATYEEVENNGN